jgi:hypothetical protein
MVNINSVPPGFGASGLRGFRGLRFLDFGGFHIFIAKIF